MSERTFDDFDEFANDYRSIHTANLKISGADSFYFAEMKVRLIQPWEKNNRLNVLDIGCGDGATELYINQYFPRWEVKGMDVSEKSIQAARERALPNANFSVYNGTEIPLKDGSIDIVFIAGVLHHVNYELHANLVREIFRVLKGEGRLYLFEHNPLNPLTRYLVNTCVFDKDARLLKSNYTVGLLQQSNFKVKDKRFIIFLPRKKMFSSLIRLEKYLYWLPLGGQYFIRAIK